MSISMARFHYDGCKRQMKLRPTNKPHRYQPYNLGLGPGRLARPGNQPDIVCGLIIDVPIDVPNETRHRRLILPYSTFFPL